VSDVLLLRERVPSGSDEPVDPVSLGALVTRAWYWPEAAEAVQRVKSATRIAAIAAPTPIDAALLATTSAAKAVDASVVAVLWESTGLLHDPKVFVEQAADAGREDLPLYLWVRFEGTRASDGTLGMRTTGLAALGAMEVEVEGSKRDGEQILECVTDVALFLLTSETVPPDGETIEVTRGELRVRRMPSLRNDGSIALRVRV